MALRPPTPVLFAAVALLGAACTSGNVIGTEPSEGGWTLVWSDEFDGPSGAAPDPTRWNVDDGVATANDELEYYTARPVNIELDGAGDLAIHLLRDSSFAGHDYTSGRVTSEGHFSQRYGRFEARIRMPWGQGVWPAFWMLGDNCAVVGWPNCGGIDVVEAYGQERSTVRAGIHALGYPDTELVRAYVAPGAVFLSDAFHLYAVEWDAGEIRWYVDDVLWQTRHPADVPVGASWPFDHPFVMILDVAIGGRFAGAPDAGTMLPQTMLVDYLRVLTR
jgi:beta-glucanase (GH16 family)